MCSLNNDTTVTIFVIVDAIFRESTISRFQLEISVAQIDNNAETCQSLIYGF
jgi:hypothetical protein